MRPTCPACHRALPVLPPPSRLGGLHHIAATVAAAYGIAVEDMLAGHDGAQTRLATEARRTAVVIAYRRYRDVPIRAITDLFGYRYEARGVVYDAIAAADRLPLLDELMKAVAA